LQSYAVFWNLQILFKLFELFFIYGRKKHIFVNYAEKGITF
jgi:hypothetical protein